MPNYDFRCQKCREVFTVERSMSESSDAAECEACGSTDVARIWNAFIMTKGSTPDVGQGTSRSGSSSGGGCGSCSSHSCGTCH